MVPEKPIVHKLLTGVDWNNTADITSVGPTLNIGKVSYLNFPKLNLWTLQNVSLPGYVNFINSWNRWYGAGQVGASGAGEWAGKIFNSG